MKNEPRTDDLVGADMAWDELHPATQRLLSRRSFLGTAGTGAAVTFLGFTVLGCTKTDSASTTGTTAASGGTAASSTTSSTRAAAGTATPGSLYSRLGGNAAITAVVGAFLTNVAADGRINARFAKTDIPRLQVLLVEQIGQATGGPEKYSGRDMKTTHAGMKITTADFNALVEDLTKALDQYTVPQTEQQDLLSALAGMKGDIVTA